MMFFIVFILTSLIFNEFNGQIIFEDDFDQLDMTKWDIIYKKADCGRLFEEVNCGECVNCNTRNEQNIRIISGKLALTIQRDFYFDSRMTSATIVSKKSFQFNPKSPGLLFKIGASLTNLKGLIPWVFLLAKESKPDTFVPFRIITILNYNIWGPGASLANLTNDYYLRLFHDYEMSFENENFVWRLNGSKLSSIIKNETRYPFYDGHFTYDPSASHLDYKLVISLIIADKKEIWNNFHDSLCHSFIIDYIRVIQFNSSEQLSTINREYNESKNQDNSRNIAEICENIDKLNRYESNNYGKFYPENFTNLLFKDEFEGNILDENKWNILGNESYCLDNYVDEKSCDVSDRRNIEVKNSKLKLMIKNEAHFGRNYTGVTIATKACFQNARVEVRAKRPIGWNLGFGIFMQTYEQGCNEGIVKGRVNIFELYGRGTNFNTKLFTGKNKFVTKETQSVRENLDEYQMYGIEWTDSFIQWFLNDRVVYQVNRIYEVQGKLLGNIDQPTFLPFDHPFNLIIHVGVKMDNFHGHYNYEEIPWLEIDWIKIYGEKIFGGNNQTIIIQEEKSQIPYAIIISTSLVFTILVIILVINVIILRKQMEKRSEDFYDDHDTKDDETYEMYQYNTTDVYEQVKYDQVKYLDIEHHNHPNEYSEMTSKS